MAKRDTLLVLVLNGTADANVPFEGLRRLLGRLRFGEDVVTAANPLVLILKYRLAGGANGQ